MSLSDLIAVARSDEIEERSRSRREPMPRQELRRMGENKHLWYSIRRHVDETVALGILRDRGIKASRWPALKNSEEEIKRKEYLHIATSTACAGMDRRARNLRVLLCWTHEEKKTRPARFCADRVA